MTDAQTIAATGWILVALALHPEIKRRAQAEIDSVTHGERLPTCDDRERMPYLDAVVKEVYRWNPVGNLGQFFVAPTRTVQHVLIL